MSDCGECTECCTVFRIDEIKKPKHVKCEHCSDKGCGIHLSKPKTCSEYECAYTRSNWNLKLRPDKCGVIIDLKDGGHKAYRLRDKVDPIIIKQIDFIQENYGIEIEGIDAR